jgi:transposase
MQAFATGHPDWLAVIQLPAYAPDLNPVEGAWSVMKNGLGNLTAGTTDQLAPPRCGTSWTASSDSTASSSDSSARPDSPSNQNRPDQ